MKETGRERSANVPEDLTGRPRRVATGGVAWQKTFSAFQYRNYRLYFWGQLVSLIGTWMTSTAQGWLVYQLTGSKALLGVVAAAGSAAGAFDKAWCFAINRQIFINSARLKPLLGPATIGSSQNFAFFASHSTCMCGGSSLSLA